MKESHTDLNFSQPQRIKNFNIDNFLDGKIAEEQARQGGAQQGAAAAPKRSSSNAGPRRGSGRTDSPARKAGSRLRVPEGDGAIAKAPDPEEFVIGDDGSDISRTATPKPVKEEGDATATSKEGEQSEAKKEEGEEKSPTEKGKEKAQDNELPEAVQQKLARLESLTSKYKGMLRRNPLHRDCHIFFTHRTRFVQNFCETTARRTPAWLKPRLSKRPCENIRRWRMSVIPALWWNS